MIKHVHHESLCVIMQPCPGGHVHRHPVGAKTGRVGGFYCIAPVGSARHEVHNVASRLMCRVPAPGQYKAAALLLLMMMMALCWTSLSANCTTRSPLKGVRVTAALKHTGGSHDGIMLISLLRLLLPVGCQCCQPGCRRHRHVGERVLVTSGDCGWLAAAHIAGPAGNTAAAETYTLAMSCLTGQI